MTEYEELDVRYEGPYEVASMDKGFKTDYIGNGRLYKDDTGQAISIYDLAELDQDQWIVVGIDLSHAGCRDYSKDTVYLWAVDKVDAEAAGRHPLQPDADGNLPVVKIKCHNLTVGQVLSNFVDAEMSFRHKAVAKMSFQLMGYADRPNMNDDDAQPDSKPSL
ncbi:hypothetical protein [Corynebacterium pseudodiphtheriticum]|uniref:hypothetical protein n=1 Tax=Corynebacterium pseudodiphtheriticum TaxID=37637 RepID=UPI003B633C4F